MVFLFNYSNLFIDQCASYDSFRYFWKKLLHGKRILRKLEDKSFQSTTSYIWGKEKELKVHAKRIKKQPCFPSLDSPSISFQKSTIITFKKRKKEKTIRSHFHAQFFPRSTIAGSNATLAHLNTAKIDSIIGGSPDDHPLSSNRRSTSSLLIIHSLSLSIYPSIYLSFTH